MSDDERRAPAHEVVHSRLDAPLGARIDRACCLVQNEHATISQNSAGDSEQLALALADIARILVDHRVVAFGQRAK